MEKRSLLAVALSAALFMVYFYFVEPPVTVPPANPAATEADLAQKPQPKLPSASLPVPSDSSPQHAETLSTWEDDFSKSQWSSVTGLPKAWQMKGFFEQAGQEGEPRELLRISSQAGEAYPFLWLLFPGQTGAVLPHFAAAEDVAGKKRYVGSYGDLSLEQLAEPGQSPYTFRLQLKVHNQGSSRQVLAPGLRLLLDQVTEERSFLNFSPQVRQLHPLYYKDSSVERLSDVEDLPVYGEDLGAVHWAALEDLYFLRAVLSRRVSTGSTSPHGAAYGKQGSQVFADFRYPLEALEPGESRTYEYTIFLGPKSAEALQPFKSLGLDKALDLGFLEIVAKPLLWALKFFHGFLFNWGLAIIALTLVIKLLTYPLTKKSMQSMKAMKEIQPKLKKLQEKYKEDKARLNQEMMSLFRTHKVNPAGGCLPMLLQMPIYFALYRVLYNATELHHAPFFGPYQDLSAPDPYFILPILMGFFFYLQQKLTPSTGDEMQAKMMRLMPIMFTGLMLFLPVGLVLYILVSTALGVLQQYMSQRDLKFVDLFKKKI